MPSKKILGIFGFGGHARIIYNAARFYSFKSINFVSDTQSAQASYDNCPVVLERDLNWKSVNCAIIAIGDNYLRKKLAERIVYNNAHCRFVTIVHPSAIIGSKVEFGCGTVVMPNTVVNCGSKIGSHCIINTSASVDHDCVLEDFVSIAPGAILAGSVHVGRATIVSLGANIGQGVSIGSNTVIGACSAVLKNIPDEVVAYGVPCEVQHTRTSLENIVRTNFPKRIQAPKNLQPRE